MYGDFISQDGTENLLLKLFFKTHSCIFLSLYQSLTWFQESDETIDLFFS